MYTSQTDLTDCEVCFYKIWSCIFVLKLTFITQYSFTN